MNDLGPGRARAIREETIVVKPPDVAGLDVLNELPRTGIWEAWRARQTSLNRLVVLKILPGPIASGLADDRAFVAAAGRVASVTHSNFVQIYDFRKHGSEYRLVTEYVPGQNLRDWIDKSRMLPVATALAVAGSIAKVMKFAWEKLGTVHGALKPHNVLLDPDGVIKVADLGLSHHFQGLASVRAAAPPGIQAVTPNYLSPEQCRLDGILDCRSDIYSLGAMLYEMITGSMPFGSMPAEEVLRRQIEGQIPNPKELNHEIPIEVSFLVEKLMTKDRDRRARGWDEVCEDIERVKAGDLPAPELPAAGASTVAFEVRARPKPAPVVTPDEPRPQRISSKLSPLPMPGGDWQAWLKQPAFWGVAVGALVILGLAWKLSAARSSRGTGVGPAPARPGSVQKKSPARPTGRPTVAQPAPEPAVDPEAKAKRAAEAEARRLLAEAKAWAEANPDYYDETIGRFEEVVRAAPDSPAAQESQGHIERLRQARTRGVQEAMAGLKTRAADLLAKRKTQEALALYERYDGPFAAETAVEREQEAAAIRRDLAARQAQAREAEARARQQAEAQARKAESEAGQKLQAAVSNAAFCLLNGAPADALQTVEAAARDTTLGPRQAEVQALRETLVEYTRLDQRVMESFRDFKGQEISVATVTGTEKVFVLGVQGDVLNAEKRIAVGEGEIRQPRTIRFADLAPAEKRQRMPREESPALALARGLMAIQAGDAAAGRESLAKAGPLLGPALLAALAERQAQQAEEAARQVLARILKAARAPMPDAEGGVKASVEALGRATYTAREAAEFKAAAEEFRRRYAQTRIVQDVAPILEALGQLRVETPAPTSQPAAGPAPDSSVASDPPQFQPAAPLADDLAARLAAANPGLGAWQIKVGLNSAGRVETVEVSSTQLRDISPLAGQADLRRVICRGGDPEKRYGDQVAAPLRDLGPLTNLALVELDVCSTSVKDLSVLRGMPLTRLDVSRTLVEDLSPVKGMALASLACEAAPIRDFSCLAGLPLTSFKANGTDLRDLSPFRGAPLTSLEARRTKVRDLSPLAGMPLRLLDLNETPIKSLDDLRGLPLEVLRIERTEIKDLSPLTGMPLQELLASQTGIKDIRALQGMPLQYLMLNQVEIKDIVPLAGMPLKALGISGTKVRDLTPLQGATSLKQLHIKGTEVKNLEPIRGLPIEILFVDFPEMHRKVLQDMPALKKLNTW